MHSVVVAEHVMHPESQLGPSSARIIIPTGSKGVHSAVNRYGPGEYLSKEIVPQPQLSNVIVSKLLPLRS